MSSCQQVWSLLTTPAATDQQHQASGCHKTTTAAHLVPVLLLRQLRRRQQLRHPLLAGGHSVHGLRGAAGAGAAPAHGMGFQSDQQLAGSAFHLTPVLYALQPQPTILITNTPAGALPHAQFWPQLATRPPGRPRPITWQLAATTYHKGLHQTSPCSNSRHAPGLAQGGLRPAAKHGGLLVGKHAGSGRERGPGLDETRWDGAGAQLQLLLARVGKNESGEAMKWPHQCGSRGGQSPAKYHLQAASSLFNSTFTSCSHLQQPHCLREAGIRLVGCLAGRARLPGSRSSASSSGRATARFHRRL